MGPIEYHTRKTKLERAIRDMEEMGQQEIKALLQEQLRDLEKQQAYPERRLYSQTEKFWTYEPQYCSTFGCGRILSLQESLFGNKCTRHAPGPKTIV